VITFDRRLRSLLVALVALIFSASIVMAAQPGNSGAGHDNGAGHGAKAGQAASGDPSESADPDQSSADESDNGDTTDAADAANHCNVDLTQDPSVLAGLNHGSVVCTAAQQDTPDGYDNHGAWVSHWAMMNHGSGASSAGKAHKPSH
jgi:hypothetical protein